MWTVNYTAVKSGLTEASYAADRATANIGSGYLDKLQALRNSGAITGVSTSFSTDTATTVTTWTSAQAHNTWTSELMSNPTWSKFRTNLANMGYTTYITKSEV